LPCNTKFETPVVRVSVIYSRWFLATVGDYICNGYSKFYFLLMKNGLNGPIEKKVSTQLYIASITSNTFQMAGGVFVVLLKLCSATFSHGTCTPTLYVLTSIGTSEKKGLRS
jgi:hypothetical protein